MSHIVFDIMISLIKGTEFKLARRTSTEAKLQIERIWRILAIPLRILFFSAHFFEPLFFRSGSVIRDLDQNILLLTSTILILRQQWISSWELEYVELRSRIAIIFFCYLKFENYSEFIFSFEKCVHDTNEMHTIFNGFFFFFKNQFHPHMIKYWNSRA